MSFSGTSILQEWFMKCDLIKVTSCLLKKKFKVKKIILFINLEMCSLWSIPILIFLLWFWPPLPQKVGKNHMKLDIFDNLVQCGKVDSGRTIGGSHFRKQWHNLDCCPYITPFLLNFLASLLVYVYQLSPPNLRKTNHLCPFCGKRIIILYLFVTACKLPKASSGLCLLFRGSLSLSATKSFIKSKKIF